MSKRHYLSLLLLSVYGCQSTPASNIENFSIQAVSSSEAGKPQAGSSSPPQHSSIKIPPPASKGEALPVRADKVLKPHFDGVIPTEKSEEALPGSVTVIYKNAYKVRVDKEKQVIKAINNEDFLAVDKILQAHGIRQVNDLAYPGITEEQLEIDVRLVSEKYGLEAPDRRSIHTYQFPNDADTKAISAELRKLPFIRSAYMTPRTRPGASANLLSVHNVTDTLSAPSNDAGFGYSETPNWWWYNRSKIFQGWSKYKVGTSTTEVDMPIIAIVDSGFDTRSVTVDKPNYLSGMSIKYDPFASPSWITGSDVMEYQADHPASTFSHGALVASVAASPKGNSTGLAGIAYGASIRPYKQQDYCFKNRPSCSDPSDWTTHRNTTAHAIFQASYSDADVINVSWQLDPNKPVIVDPALNNEVVAASVSRGKAVVIIAGNGNFNIDYTNEDPLTSALPDCGDCTIVGASMYDNFYNSKQWLDTGTKGSNYGDRVDVVAGGHNIAGTTFYFPTGAGQLFTGFYGTSFAAPMVSAGIGMVKKMAAAHGLSINPAKMRGIITTSATARRFSPSSTPNTSETLFMGWGLSLSGLNPAAMVGMRELNLLNALIIAKYSADYPALARIHNIDDYAAMTFNGNWGSYYQQGFGNDAIYGLDGILTGETVDFYTYNNSTGGYAFGYQGYKDGWPVAEIMGGVTYVTGANNNASYPVGWYENRFYTHY